MIQKYFNPANKPVLDKYGQVLVGEKKIKKEVRVEKRQYPLTEEECFFERPQAMFPIDKLNEAYSYFLSKLENVYSAERFYFFLLKLEKDVPMEQQKYQP